MDSGKPIEGRDDVGIGMFRASLSLGILVLLTIISYMDRTVINLMVDPIKASLDITDFQFSLLSGLAFAIFYACFSMPLGWLADRFSRRWIIFLGVTTWSLATAASGFAGTFMHLFWARVVVGAGEATLSPAGYAMVGDLFSKRRLGVAIGVLAAGTSLGAAVALTMGGAIVRWLELSGGFGGFEPWQVTFFVIGLPGLIIAPLVFLIPKAADRPAAGDVAASPKAAEAPGYGAFLRQNASYLAPLFVAAGLIAASVICAAGWGPAYMMRHFKLNAAEAGLYLGLATGTFGALGFVTSGWLVDKMVAMGVKDAHFRYLIFMMPTTHIFAVLGFAFSPTWEISLFCIAMLLLFAPMNSTVIPLLQICTPIQYRARTIALFMMVFQLIGVLFGMASGALASEIFFDGPQDIGLGVAAISFGFGVLGTILILVAWMPARRAVERAQAAEMASMAA